jgi:hypothetical protein
MTTFEELYPELGSTIAGANAQNTSTPDNNEKWWQTLIAQIPDIIGVFVPRPGTNQTPQLITEPRNDSNDIFSTNNLVKIIVVAVVVILMYKIIQKLL